MRAFFRWSCRAVACAVLLIEVNTAAAANKYVVIAADPPIASLPLGHILKVEDQIDVPAGALLTLLGDDGTVATVSGPRRLIVTAEPESDSAEAIMTRTTFQRISDLLLGSPDDGKILGGLRSVGQSQNGKELFDPWTVPIDFPGHACVQGNSIKLRRSKDLEERYFSVEVGGVIALAASIWEKDQMYATLPPVDLGPKREMAIKLDGKSNTFRIHTLPAEIDPSRGIDVLAWMLESGCKVQAVNFAHQLSEN